ncbi:hypothetical protein SAMN05428989_1966 [Pseudoxanthomonas sp. GM95]|uniref:hypothetical protein n=1 Tax=Pseudoxanthomonas sp. GM95 TaxID=1881043 RepID=UPI0008B6955E|nr:hypothetical protein [Pseudoxanthomonas sp. GM95]SEL57631.1 hypothetical protein SAMN05428989_1966 [Pseudoxanthomonas sp. GM95]
MEHSLVIREEFEELQGRLEAHRAALRGLLRHLDEGAREAVRKELAIRAIVDGEPSATEAGMQAEAADLVTMLGFTPN